MGASNAVLVFARWAHLPDRAFRVLAFMALVTMDEDDPPRYWGGREALAEALGRTVPPEPAPSDASPRAEDSRKARKADFEAVKAAMRALFRAGVVEVEEVAAPGRNAVYRLCLHAGTGKAEPVERGRFSLPTGKAEPVERGRLSLPPRRDLPTGGPPSEEQEGIQGGTKSPQVTNSPANVHNSAPKNDESADEYATAHRILLGLPDLGAIYLDRVNGDTLKARVIAAAKLCISERRAG